MGRKHLVPLAVLGTSVTLGVSTAESSTAQLGYIGSPIASNGTSQLNYLNEFVLATNGSTTTYELGVVGNGLGIGPTDPLSDVSYGASQTLSGGAMTASTVGFNGTAPLGIITVSGEDFNFTLGPGATATFPLSWTFDGFTSAIPINSWYYEEILVTVNGSQGQDIADHYIHQASPTPPPYSIANTYNYTITNSSASPVTYDVTVAVVDEQDAQQSTELSPYAQQITFTPPDAGKTAFSVSASSGLPVVLTSTTPSICSVSGLSVTALASGTCTVAANQGGSFNGAPLVVSNTPYGGTISGWTPPYFLPAATTTQSFSVGEGLVYTGASGNSSGNTDGPIPLWALGTLGAGLFGIASRQLKKAL